MWIFSSLLACHGSTPTSDDTVPAEVSAIPCDACAGVCDLEQLTYVTDAHTAEALDYAEPPPAGGPHNPCWAAWGVHEEAVPDDRWVHNLEHGGIVYLYDCPLGCDPEREELTTLAQELGAFVLVTPYEDLDRAFAAIAWGVRMQVDCVDVGAFRAFYEDHVDDSPESSSSDPPVACE
jgi:hypothetical protein